jgi:predicted small metal-binding protein
MRPASETRTRALFPSSSQEVAAFFPTLVIVVAMEATNKAVRCDCGHEVRAVSEEQLLAEVQEHARAAHDIEFSREDALLVVLRAELQGQWFEEPARSGGASADPAAACRPPDQKGASA